MISDDPKFSQARVNSQQIIANIKATQENKEPWFRPDQANLKTNGSESEKFH